MPIDFPTSPTTGQIYTNAGFSWKWNGAAWDSVDFQNDKEILVIMGVYGG